MQVEHTADCFGGAWFKSPLSLSVIVAYAPTQPSADADRVSTTMENLENLEISGNLLFLENSGKTQGI